MVSCDFLIIGGGSSGLKLAKELSKQSKNILLVESNQLGGSSLHYLETPKYLYHQEIKRLQNILSLFTLHKSNINQIDKLRSIIPKQVTQKLKIKSSFIKHELEGNPNVSVLIGKSVFISKNTISIRVEGVEKLISFKHCAVCVGKNNVDVLEIPGIVLEKTLTDYSIWTQNALPQSLAIIGLNQNSLEVALLFSAIGVPITIFEKKPLSQILQHIDHSILDYLYQTLENAGVVIEFESLVNRVTYTKHSIEVSSPKGTSEFDTLYVCSKEQFTNELSLESAGIKYDNFGIKTNKSGKTATPTIYSFGDCNASNTSLTLIQDFINTFRKRKILQKHKLITRTFFHTLESLQTLPSKKSTQPRFVIRGVKPVVSSGLSQKQAQETFGKKIQVKIFTGITVSGMVKLVYNTHSSKLLGYSLIGDCVDYYDSFLHYALEKSMKYELVLETLSNYINSDGVVVH
jgi:pyruvate/2-oxoglutarate dehydrogenase complex dihydrolipoamide dehydrogenase (E3) component